MRSLKASTRTGDLVDVQVALSVVVKSTTASYILFAMKIIELKKRKKKRRKKKNEDTETLNSQPQKTSFSSSEDVTVPNVSSMSFLYPPIIQVSADTFESIKPDDDSSINGAATSFSFLQ